MLAVRGLIKRFDGFAAVDGVDLDVAPGTIHSVIGPNGAGKTTLFRVLTGAHRPTHGTVDFAGESITGLRPHTIVRKGLSQSFQITNVFLRMSVIQSIEIAVLARRRRSGRLFRGSGSQVHDEALALLERVGMADRAAAAAQTLSHGDQRVLEVALALASRPRMLLLDEPTAGMSPFETDRMVQLVTDIADSDGVTVLLSEHDMDIVFGISDTVTVLHRGSVIVRGTPEEVQGDERVIEVYLGTEA